MDPFDALKQAVGTESTATPGASGDAFDNLRASVDKIPETKPTTVSAPATTQAPAEVWGPGKQFSSGFYLGFGPQIAAFGAAGKQALSQGSLSTFGKDYDAALEQYKVGKKTYEQENPLTSSGLELAGNVTSTVPLLMAGGGALAAGGNALLRSAPVRAVPALEAAGKFVTGQAGQGEGVVNALTRVGSRATSGASQGVAASGLLAEQSDEDLGKQLATGAVLGGGLGVAAPVAVAAGKKVGNVIRDAVEPFTDSGQSAIANRFIQSKAQGGNFPAVTSPFDPRITPTLAQATQNPGLFSLDKAVRATSPAAAAFTERDAANAAIRSTEVGDLVGSPQTVDALKASRKAAADPLRDAALSNATETDPKSVVRLIDKILAGPEGKRNVVVKELSDIKDKLILDHPLPDRIADPLDAIRTKLKGPLSKENADALNEAKGLLNKAARGDIEEEELITGLKGIRAASTAAKNLIRDATAAAKAEATKLETNPNMLYGVRKAIADALDPVSKAAGSNAQLASKELQKVKHKLDEVIETGAPGFQKYLETFRDASRPIDTQLKLQSLNLTDAKGNITLGKVDAALKNIEKERAAPGARKADSIPDDMLRKLYALRDDLRMTTPPSAPGKPVGSDTFENLATDRLASRMAVPLGAAAEVMGLGVGIPGASAALGGGARYLYGRQQGPIMNKLIEQLLDPRTSLQSPVKRGGNRIIDNAIGYGGTGAGLVTNRLTSQPQQ